MHPRRFTYLAAQSRTIVVAVSGILLIETGVLHLWITSRSPLAAWILTATSFATLIWLWRENARYCVGALEVRDGHIQLMLGTRWRGVVPLAQIQSAVRPSWQEVPQSGTVQAADYVNITKPSDPNVLIILTSDVPLRAFGMVTKRVRRIGVHLDAPDDFLQAIQSR